MEQNLRFEAMPSHSFAALIKESLNQLRLQRGSLSEG